jgi:hypothetical protein
MTQALIILLAVAIPIGLYAWHERHTVRLPAEQPEEPEQSRDLLAEFCRWDEDGRP